MLQYRAIFTTLVLASSISSESLASYSQPSESLISQSGKSREIDIRKISIGRLKLDTNIKEIAKILGQPRQHQQTQGNTSRCVEKGIILKYNKLDITLGGYPNPSSIFTISTSNPVYATGEGVHVGDPISKAKKAYSKYKSTVQGQYLIYPANLGESSLTFKINKGLITEITLDEGC
jgi:hypothetical protein